MRSVAAAGGGAGIALRMFGQSHRGLKRPNNEDAYLMRAVNGDGVLVAVADGVGGGPAGQEASRIALETLDAAIVKDVLDIGGLVAAASQANRRVFESGQRDQSLTGMGTTLTSAVVFPQRLLVVHVGDSRAYQLVDDHLVRLTVDHSIAGEMEAAGGITADEARRHPNRNVLTRVVGPFDRVRMDASEIPWDSRSRLLLCTDGLTAVLSDEDIVRVSRPLSGQSLVDALIDLALHRGGPDNITVVLAEDDQEWSGSHGG